MKRLLCILSNMNAGGAETFLMKLYRTIDRTKYQFDFCINVEEKCFYEDEIKSLGGSIYRIPTKTGNYNGFRQGLENLIKSQNYQYVLKITSNTIGFLELKIAKKAGVKVCCVRSSNSNDEGGLKAKIAHLAGRVLYSKYIDKALAPSDLAAKYTFGEKAYKDGKVHILHNALDLDYFCYDENARYDIRKELNIDKDALVVGHVGRFMVQKNHMFLAEVFRCIKEKENNAKLLLVGNGELQEQFKIKASELGILDSVIFTGIRSDIPNLLSAMDVMVFPSLYEGMPNCVIEAQATGLPCIIADTITKEANITGLVTYLSLNDSKEKWARKAIDKSNRERINTRGIFVKQKYEIEDLTKEFVKIVFEE